MVVIRQFTCTMTMGVLLATAWWAVSSVPGPPSKTKSTTGTYTEASTDKKTNPLHKEAFFVIYMTSSKITIRNFFLLDIQTHFD